MKVRDVLDILSKLSPDDEVVVFNANAKAMCDIKSQANVRVEKYERIDAFRISEASKPITVNVHGEQSVRFATWTTRVVVEAAKECKHACVDEKTG